MPPRHGSAPLDPTRNRKMKGVVIESPAVTQLPTPTIPMSLFPVHPNQQDPIDLDSHLTRPFTSYTALLTEGDEEEFGPAASYRRMQHHAEQAVKAHSDQVRNMLFDVWRQHYTILMNAAHDEAGKKLKEKDEQLNQAMMRIAELERTVGQLTYQGQFFQARVKTLERMNGSMKAALHEASLRGAFSPGGNGVGGSEAAQQEDAESSFVDPNRVSEDMKLGQCKNCDKGEATVLIWPCRHVCVCTGCAAAVKACPVCKVPKFNSVEVILQ